MHTANQKSIRLFSLLLILTGLAIALYPAADRWLADRTQQKLLAQAEMPTDLVSLSDARIAAEPLRPQQNRNDYAPSASSTEETAEGMSTVEEAPAEGTILGMIQIDKINVRLPVLEGATKENMRYASARVSSSAPLGSVGNSAIAAHRAHKRGRLFNRLGEMKIGDLIQIQTKGRSYTYYVNKISRVEPMDVSVLDGGAKNKELTLITCDPLINPTRRLIVHAVMEP